MRLGRVSESPSLGVREDPRAGVRRALLTCLLTGLLALAGGAPADAAQPCGAPVASAGAVRISCEYVGELQTFTVPAHVKAVTLLAEGAEGAGTEPYPGAEGGQDSGTLAVTPGEVLTILTGGTGDLESGGFGGGGAGGPGTGLRGYGGGGGSFVYNGSGELVIAAGGGGGSGNTGLYLHYSGASSGGGETGELIYNELIGHPGTQSGPGAAGTLEGSCGATAGGGPASWVAGAPDPGTGGEGATGKLPFYNGGGGGGGGYYGGGGGCDYLGGGGGSGYLAAQLTATRAIIGGRHGNGLVTISYTFPPPTATITAPSPGGIYKEGEVVATAFSCAESELGTGLASCLDSNGSSSPGELDTATRGTHIYKVTATSKDGLTGTAQIEYTVIAPQRTLDVEVTGSGTVTSTPAGISCPGGKCSAEFEEGTVVTLNPVPAIGERFAGWSGSCTGTGACEVTIGEAQTVTATFEPEIPHCRLHPRAKVALDPKAHGHKAAPRGGVLAVDVICDQAATVTLEGTLVIEPLLLGTDYEPLPFGPVQASVAANVETAIEMPLPTTALKPLEEGVSEVVQVSLSATDKAGTSYAKSLTYALRPTDR